MQYKTRNQLENSFILKLKAMMKLIHKIITNVIRRSGLSTELNRIIADDKIKDCFKNCIHGNSFFYEEARIRNFPKNKNKISIGDNTHIRGELLVFNYGGQIEIGNWCYVGEGTRIWSGEKISIGNHVLIAHNVNIMDFSHETNYKARATGFMNLIATGHPKEKGEIPTGSIVIEDHVAIYADVNIARGVRIGMGSIISAGSVVINDVPPCTLIMGNPGRQMMKLPSDEK